ncbi:MAG: hypothetical protein Fur003_4070 [Candidatus Dojkabacteria bacterium]
MKFKFTKQFIESNPTLREGILIVKGLDNTFHPDHSFQFLCEKMDEQRVKFAHKNIEEQLKQDPFVEKFAQMGLDFKKFKPSHIALLSRVLEKVDLPNINPIVNIINAIQVEEKLPIGAHDLDKIEGDITIGANSKELTFLPRDSKESEKVAAEELVHADEKHVLTRNWCWRQGRLDLCDEKTTNVVFFLNSLDEKQNLEQLAKALLAALATFTGNQTFTAEFGILNAQTPELSKLEPITTTNRIDLETRVISRDSKLINRIIKKATEEILPSEEALKALLTSGRRLRVYQGFDPTGDTLHIGHTVTMRKLEVFRKLGHQVIFLIGDFTARIGDPDKMSTRKPLTKDEVEANLRQYKTQASRIVDIDNKENPVKVYYNSSWLEDMNFSDILQLTSNFTVQQMIKRDMFAKRIENDSPLYIHEFMYPMMQGWDAVQMKIDVELGGNDQLFNMLAGRQLVGSHLGKEKFVIAGKLLATADGTKMGKTTGNMIKLSDSANDIYGKVMAMTDEQIVPGFELLTNYEMYEVEEVAEELKQKRNPMELKKRLALTLTTELKGEKEAKEAARYFEEVFQKGSTEAELEVVKVDKASVGILELLTSVSGFAKSNSEARRLVEQGAVKIDGMAVEKFDFVVDVKRRVVLKVGKRVVAIEG